MAFCLGDVPKEASNLPTFIVEVSKKHHGFCCLLIGRELSQLDVIGSPSPTNNTSLNKLAFFKINLAYVGCPH